MEILPDKSVYDVSLLVYSQVAVNELKFTTNGVEILPEL